MKIIKESMKKGKYLALVELEPGEMLMGVHPDLYYKLGYPSEDIITGEILGESVNVHWCSIEQKWIDGL